MGASPIQRINVEGVARLPSFSHATVADGFVHVSGVLGTQEGTLNLVSGIGDQTRRALGNLRAVLAAAGATAADVVKVNVYLVDQADFPAMNAAYDEFFGATHVPARATVGVQWLAMGALVEIDCLARTDVTA
ncbi:MAG TPA: RidA family protein [Jatrophihabitans sp.]|jgi:2-iminobutanoate/2-iminopropanoate deaminase